MMNTPSRISSPRHLATATAAAIAGFLLCGGLLAADPLTMAPADAACVVVFRNLKTTAQKINPFLKRLNPDFHGLDLDEFGQRLGLEAEDWDPASPVIVILAQPAFSKESMVIGFTPAKGSGLLAQEHEKRIRKCEGPEGERFMVIREGTAFIGPSIKALRMIRPRPEARSFAEALDEQEKSLLAKSDAFVRLDLSRWRDKISPMFMLGLGMMKLGAAAETKGGEQVGAVLDWMAGGARAFIDQMESTSLALSFDGETFRFDHYHRFTPHQSVAQYFSQVRPGEGDLLGMLPDRPFLMFAASNWHCPKGECLTVSLSRHMMGMEAVVQRMPEETRTRLAKELVACYGQIRGSAFMLASEPGRAMPLELVGGYAVKDSTRAMKQLCYIQENASKAMSALLPGMKCEGKFVRRRERDVDFMEIDLASKDLPAEMRQEMDKVYGEKVRYQQAMAGPNRVVYTMAEPPTNVVDLVKNEPGNRIDKNPAVSRILGRLPSHPHAIVVFNLEHTLAAVPYLAASATSCPAVEKTPLMAEPSKCKTRGLIGWSAVAGPTTLSGQFAMDAQDAVETFKLAREMPQKLTNMTGNARSKMIHKQP